MKLLSINSVDSDTIIQFRVISGYLPAKLRKSKLKKKKNVDTITVNVLRHLPFRRNQPLKSADDKQIGVLHDIK